MPTREDQASNNMPQHGDLSDIQESEVNSQTSLDSEDETNIPPQSPAPHSIHSVESSETDDYIASDDDLSLALSRSYELHPNLNFTGSLSDHANYFINTLNTALESIDLDKSLALQAQISGTLNNENQKVLEKKEQVVYKLKNLQVLFTKHFHGTSHEPSKIEQMKYDIKNLEQRIAKLKHGNSSIIPFKPNDSGVINKYPIEYNQAKDKVLERQIDEETINF